MLSGSRAFSKPLAYIKVVVFVRVLLEAWHPDVL